MGAFILEYRNWLLAALAAAIWIGAWVWYFWSDAWKAWEERHSRWLNRE